MTETLLNHKLLLFHIAQGSAASDSANYEPSIQKTVYPYTCTDLSTLFSNQWIITIIYKEFYCIKCNTPPSDDFLKYIEEYV